MKNYEKARDIFEKLVKGYTEKQWGRDCKDLPAFIIKRLPVRLTFDNNYFNDRYQGIPIGGYTAMIEKMLAETTKYGLITIRRIYGDWTASNMGGWKEVLQTHAIQPIQQFHPSLKGLS